MSFSTQQIEQLNSYFQDVQGGMFDLACQTTIQGQPLEATSQVREHLLHGVGRRIRTIQRAVSQIFCLFPLEQTKPLSQDALSDAQINLHAFVMNVYGLYDNWAWVFVLQHDLLDEVGGRGNVGLFKRKTQRFLPAPLRQYIEADRPTRWHNEYAKVFRDALAHRIPPYIPPAEFTDQDTVRFNALDAEESKCIKEHRFDRVDQIQKEKAEIGTPAFYFLHAFTEPEQPKLCPLHGQILTDCAAATEFGKLFLQHWKTRDYPPA